MKPKTIRALRNIGIGDTVVAFDFPAGTYIKGVVEDDKSEELGFESFKIRVREDSRASSKSKTRKSKVVYVPKNAANDYLSRVTKVFGAAA